jgi:hypothetical protein
MTDEIDMKKLLRSVKVSDAAQLVLDHDINPDDSYPVRAGSARHYPKAGKQFIAKCNKQARNIRDECRMNAVFATIEKQTPAAPLEVSDDNIASVADDLAEVIWRFCDEGDDERVVPRYAALLLIKQTAWRKFEAELAAYEGDELDD